MIKQAGGGVLPWPPAFIALEFSAAIALLPRIRRGAAPGRVQPDIIGKKSKTDFRCHVGLGKKLQISKLAIFLTIDISLPDF